MMRVESGDRALIRAALLDITLDVAVNLASKANALVQQNHSEPAAQARTIRKLRADWRAIVKGVKSAYDDHPISDVHLYAVAVSHFPDLVHCKLWGDCSLPFDAYARLRNCGRTHAAAALRDVLARICR
jgi:hypothetical protein